VLKIIDKLGKLVGILKDDATEPEMKKTIMQIVCKDCQFHPCVCEKDKENK
jgi:hypothetical protein